jgi:hypothetical protein
LRIFKHTLLSVFLISMIFFDLDAKAPPDDPKETTNPNDKSSDSENDKTGDSEKKEKENPPHKEGDKEEKDKAPDTSKLVKEGNLAFPTSQQPNPLVSFGQNILNKKQAQFLLLTSDLEGKKFYDVVISPSILYGFTDELSIYLTAPFAVRLRDGHDHSSGAEDATIQLEYALWTKEFVTYYDQLTIVGNVSIPTGSTKKTPQLGIGANSFFIGGTYSRMMIDWFWFTSYGGTITTTSHRNKYGDQFLYQYGFGRRIFSNKDWLLDWMLEIDGVYVLKDRILGHIDPNSGGQIINLTPSLFLASENMVLQLGVEFPTYQSLNGNQQKYRYNLLLNAVWTF